MKSWGADRRRAVPLYKSAGAHPVVFIWETGFLETVTHNLSDIHNTKLFKKILAFAVQQLAKRLNIPEFTRGPGQRESVNKVEARLFAPGGMQSYDTAPVNVQARGGADGLSDEDAEVIQREAQAEIEEQLQEQLAQDEALGFVLGRDASESPLLDKTKVADNET